jgi:hypothetical protein
MSSEPLASSSWSPLMAERLSSEPDCADNGRGNTDTGISGTSSSLSPDGARHLLLELWRERRYVLCLAFVPTTRYTSAFSDVLLAGSAESEAQRGQRRVQGRHLLGVRVVRLRELIGAAQTTLLECKCANEDEDSP